MKSTCKKSFPVNLLQVSNLTSEPYFKVKWGHHSKMVIYLSFTLYIGPWAFKLISRINKLSTL